MREVTRYLASAAQRRMFLQHATHPDDTSFDLAFAFRIDGPLDFKRLKTAAEAVLGAGPGMNTYFENESDGLIAIVGERATAVDLVEIPPFIGTGSNRATREDSWVRAQVESALNMGPINPSDHRQLRMRLYRGATAGYLTLTCGHIVGDAYSFYRVMNAIGTIYGMEEDEWPSILGGLADHPGTVPPPSVSDRAKATYSDLLAGVESFEHTVLTPERAASSIPGIELPVRITGISADRIRRSAIFQEFGASTAFFAAYASTLQQLSGEESVTIGVPVAGRAGHRARNAIGFFVNTLPLPVHVRPSQTWRELCEEIRHGLRVLQANQGVNLVGDDRSLINGDTQFHGVDNAVTIYTQGLVLDLEGARVTSLHLSRPTVPYPFSVTVADDQIGYDIVVKIAAHLIDARPESLLMAAVQSMTTDPSLEVVQSSVFVDTDTTVETGSDAQSEGTVLDAIDSAARKNPTATALRTGAESLSYGELIDRAYRFAAALDASGATSHVMVQMPKSSRTVISILGVLASGRAYVPIDPGSPDARNMLVHSQLERFLGTAPTVIDADLAIALSQRSSVSSRLRRPTGDDDAYVIFTSGSTGEPKGVVVPHRNIVSLLASTGDALGLSEADTWCAFHSLAFDFSVWEVFGALSTGGTLIIPTEEEVRSPVAFLALLHRDRVSVLNQTPSAFRRLSDAVATEVLPLEHIRLVVFGGEAFYPTDLRAWLSSIQPNTRFINMYGITETTVHVTLYEVPTDDITSESRSRIGRPLAHLQGLVVDRFGRRSPVGVAGELLVTGSSLSTGYLGRQDLTAQRFRTIERDGRPCTAFLTGDKVYELPDGDLVYVGRFDDQVQLRGYRIELGEVESAFSALMKTGTAIVRLVERPGVEPYLAAWVTISEPASTAGSGTETEVCDAPVRTAAHGQVAGESDRRCRQLVLDLRRSLADELPHYMIPSVIVPLTGIPMTVNGKPDLAQLLELERLQRLPAQPLPGATSQQYNRGPGSLEEQIAGVWSDVIGAGAVDVEDRFMDVGGTSMHVMRVHGRLNSELHPIEIDLLDLFEHPTARSLATHLAQKNPRLSSSVSPLGGLE